MSPDSLTALDLQTQSSQSPSRRPSGRLLACPASAGQQGPGISNKLGRNQTEARTSLPFVLPVPRNGALILIKKCKCSNLFYFKYVFLRHLLYLLTSHFLPKGVEAAETKNNMWLRKHNQVHGEDSETVYTLAKALTWLKPFVFLFG